MDAIIFTDIDRDGLMKGLNSDDTKKLSDHVNIPVIGSGGINGPDNLENIKNIPNLEGISLEKLYIQAPLGLKMH